MEIKARDFSLEATLDSGQVFCFDREPDGSYRGVMSGRAVLIVQEGETLNIETKGRPLTEEWVRTYFNLDQDLSGLYGLLDADPKLSPFLRQFRGLRIIRQDPWEALACFILSQNNNTRRIQKIYRGLSRTFSEGGLGFPEPSRIARSTEAFLRSLGLGYRAPFLLESARQIVRKHGWFCDIASLDYERACAQLLQLPGVGPKVADCILLFGFQKYEAFPVDIWIWRAVRKLYFKGRKVSKEKIRAFGRKRWGSYAGYIQQYVYHGARSGNL